MSSSDTCGPLIRYLSKYDETGKNISSFPKTAPGSRNNLFGESEGDRMPPEMRLPSELFCLRKSYTAGASAYRRMKSGDKILPADEAVNHFLREHSRVRMPKATIDLPHCCS